LQIEGTGNSVYNEEAGYKEAGAGTKEEYVEYKHEGEISERILEILKEVIEWFEEELPRELFRTFFDIVIVAWVLSRLELHRQRREVDEVKSGDILISRTHMDLADEAWAIFKTTIHATSQSDFWGKDMKSVVSELVKKWEKKNSRENEESAENASVRMIPRIITTDSQSERNTIIGIAVDKVSAQMNSSIDVHKHLPANVPKVKQVTYVVLAREKRINDDKKVANVPVEYNLNILLFHEEFIAELLQALAVILPDPLATREGLEELKELCSSTSRMEERLRGIPIWENEDHEHLERLLVALELIYYLEKAKLDQKEGVESDEIPLIGTVNRWAIADSKNPQRRNKKNKSSKRKKHKDKK